MKKAAKKAKQIIAVSKATKEEIIDHLSVKSEKIEVIYEGVDGLISSSGGQKINFPFLLYVGNCYPHKNVERAIAAFKSADKPTNAKFVFIGREDFFRQRLVEVLKKNNMTDKIVFAGEVSDSELANYYRQARATIIPSLMEGFGLPALEAMRNKCLVICSNIPSLREVCVDAALYFDPLDIGDIKKTIESAFSLDNSNLIMKGLKRSEQFSWEKMAKETLKIYESSASL